MNRRRRYAEPSALLAFVQIHVGTVLLLPLDDPTRVRNNLAYASVSCIAGVALLALGGRNCRRLWHLATEGGSRRRSIGRLLGALFCLWAGAGSLVDDRWRGVTYLVFSVFLLALVVRENRHSATGSEPAATAVPVP